MLGKRLIKERAERVIGCVVKKQVSEKVAGTTFAGAGLGFTMTIPRTSS